MSRRAWTLIGVLAALVLLVGAYVVLTRPKAAPAPAAALPELSKGDKDKVTRIVLTDRPEGTLTLVRNADTWHTDPPFAGSLEPTSIDNLLFSFSALTAERVIEALLKKKTLPLLL